MSLIIDLFSFRAVLTNLVEFMECVDGVHLMCCSRDMNDVHNGQMVPMYARMISTTRHNYLSDMIVDLNKHDIVPNIYEIICDKLKVLLPSFVLDGTFYTSLLFENKRCKQKFTLKRAINKCFFDSWTMIRQVKMNTKTIYHYFTAGVKVRTLTTGDAIELNTYLGTFDYFGNIVDNMLTLSWCQCFDKSLMTSVSITAIEYVCNDCMCLESNIDMHTNKLMHHKAEAIRLERILNELCGSVNHK